MNQRKPSYEELERRLAEAEAALEALRHGEIDTFMGDTEPLVVRFKSVVDERERIQAEAERLAREWQTTFGATNDVILILDMDRRVVRANKAAERLFKCSEKDMVGKPCWEFVHGTTEPIPECPFDSVRESLQRRYFEMQVGERWFNVKVDPILDMENNFTGLIHISTDITERKQVEEALRASEERNRCISETISDYIYSFHVEPDGTMRGGWVNEAFTRTFGLTVDEIENRGGWQTMVHPDDLTTAVEHARKVVNGDRDVCEMRFVTRAGEERWLRDYAIPVWSEEEKRVVRIYGAAQDITDQKRSEEEKERLQQQLYQSQKMEAVGRLAGGVAHDFNNLLGIILGYGEMILSRLHPMDPLWESAKEIVDAGKRATTLTRQLLAFSRKQSLQPVIIDLNSIIRDLDKMLRRLIGEDIELELVLSDDLKPVLVDPGQMEQVIMNLSINARDAMPEGGKLIIKTENVELDQPGARRHSLMMPGPYVLLSITDTGCGMDEDVLAQIFEPFFTTKEKGKGTGLGLSTVYGIIKQSGGEICVDSTPGKGTSFYIYLPQKVGEPEAKKTEESREGEAGRGEHVLVVEDEASLRGLIEQMLIRLGYRVSIAAGGGDALLLVEEKGLRPDLLLTDVVMPGMDGSVLAKRLRRTLPDLKILYMSGYTDNAIAHRGVLLPGIPFIHKPFGMQELGNALHKALHGKKTN